MVTKTEPKKTAAKSTNGKKEKDGTLKLPPIKKQQVTMRIVGTSPLIHHNWDEKSKETMRDKHAGKKTKKRDVRNPKAEGEAAMYRTADGAYGAPAMSIKGALISAAHIDIGVAKTLVKKAVFMVCDSTMILEMDCDEPEIKEDTVRVGQGSTDLRYRPYYHRWSIVLKWEIDAELFQVEDLLNLVDRAGFGVGIGEWRPEKGGEYGRFEVDRTYPVEVI